MNFRASVILGSLAILNGAFLVQGQIDRATVTGTLHDPAGAAVAGAKVTLTYRDTGVTRSVTSNGSGAYLISGLPLGSVVIEAQQSGFRMIRSDTKLNVGETLTLDLTFELATVDNSVQVVADVDLERSSAAIGQTFQNNQLEQLPVNGRNFENLMALVPGAVDTGAGNGSSVRFFGHGGDDNNFRIDGVDATSVRNQTQAKSRLVISMDAIAEFRVNAALYSAETGGASGGQVEVVSKGGTNIIHGSLFEYFRNSILDSRSPFDGKTVPAFRLNQFGATLGGPVRRDRTFFFLSYEGLIQRQGRTQIGFVPDAAFRAAAPAALQPLLALYPVGQVPTNIRNVLQWTGVGSATQDEHSGLARLDHRFTDKLSGYFRFSKNDTVIFSPNAALPYGTSNLDAPTSGLFDFLYLVSPRTTNELRLAANYSQPLNSIPTGAPASISIPSLSTIPGGNRRIAIGISESLVDQWATLRGPHTVKAGVEIRRVQLNVHDFNLSDATASYASLADFQSNRLNTLAGSGELPTKGLRKIEYFGYVQDEWKIKPNFIANIGLRYEFYNRFSERNNRDVPFDIQACGGYCRPGSEFAYPDLNNFAPRLSLAWSPAALRDRTVIRAGGGIYYGDAQLGDQYSPANNDAVRYTLSQATTPGLSYPFDSFINATGALATAPRSNPLNRRNQVSQQWGLSIQQALNARVSATVSYSGQKGTHVFSRTYVNVLDPVTKLRPLPGIDQVDVRGSDGVSSYHGFVSSLQANNWRGLLAGVNYVWSHAINDGSSGGGGSDGAPQNVVCRSCDKGNSSIDARHVFTANFSYQIPFGRSRWYGGWDWSGIATGRTGLPINVTVTRTAASLPDGNALSAERPNIVPGVSPYLDYGTTGRWLNLAAFAIPAAGQFGNLGRNTLRAPGLFQVDTALSKRVPLSERVGFEFGWQIFNIANHPQLGPPASNVSSSSNFGRITAPVNPSPIGAGTPRQMQVIGRFYF